jgi:hypothetical protein
MSIDGRPPCDDADDARRSGSARSPACKSIVRDE